MPRGYGHGQSRLLLGIHCAQLSIIVEVEVFLRGSRPGQLAIKQTLNMCRIKPGTRRAVREQEPGGAFLATQLSMLLSTGGFCIVIGPHSRRPKLRGP
jgi:hypothetical protein